MPRVPQLCGTYRPQASLLQPLQGNGAPGCARCSKHCECRSRTAFGPGAPPLSSPYRSERSISLVGGKRDHLWYKHEQWYGQQHRHEHKHKQRQGQGQMYKSKPKARVQAPAKPEPKTKARVKVPTKAKTMARAQARAHPSIKARAQPAQVRELAQGQAHAGDELHRWHCSRR